ncbi:MAG TPA: hypothetical protein PKM57_15405 [Kiritimatiellia bacterium]|nr:hypothetical protein [Kiritimatiellia bacterium]HPS07120.1 hypothetical protein [Kiritimatiellia bacterium]
MKQRLQMLAGMCLVLMAGAVRAAAPDASFSAQVRSWGRWERCSGAPGSLPISRADFRQLAFELQNSRAAAGCAAASAAQRRPYDALVAPRNNLRREVPLCVIHWERTVATELTNAQGRTLATAGNAAEPGLTNRTVFAFSPVRPETCRGAQAVFTLNADGLFEEGLDESRALAALRVDAGDGSGWHAIGQDRPVAVSYTSTGIRTVTLEGTLADGTVLLASAPLEVVALATPDPSETVLLSSAKLYTYKAGTHAGYRNPVLVCEGFDLDNAMDWDVLYALLNKEQLVETLRAYGRDLAVVDFNDATTNIYSNAANVMEAIRFINTCRADAADKFTVIGASMGGLVTRYALDRMEAEPALYGPHDVDTWISFDSPQEGANIPLGLQAFFSFFGGYGDDYSSLAAALEYRKKIDTVAAQQMLLCHYKNTAAQAGRSPAYAGFETEMRAYGYPSGCKKVAITNGSKFGLKHPFSPGDQIINWYLDSFTLGVSSRIYALYDAPTPVRPVFYGWFDPWDFWDEIDDTVTENRYYPYSIDNAPGGTRASFRELFDTLPSDMKDADDYCAYPDHCFIPTASALGLPREYMELNLATNAAVLALSPFDEIHCAVTNEAHIDINLHNKRWFMRAVLEGNDEDGDGFDDYREYLMGTDYASDASRLDMAIGFSMDAVPGASTLSWPALPNVRYDIYRTDALDQAWTFVESVSCPAATAASKTYPMDAQKRSAFYKVVATVVDPVVD